MAHKHQKKVFWAILLTETSHIFCCVLPTLFSLMSLLMGFGLVASVPAWLSGYHAFMHQWEFPVLLLSAVVVALGWGFHFYSYKEDCHEHGCHHGSCGPTKRRASKILIAASVLLVVNFAVYFGLHRQGIGLAAPATTDHAEHEHHH